MGKKKDDGTVQIVGAGSQKQPGSLHCHRQVAEVAKAAAHELFDTLMLDQAMYDMWRKRFPGMSAKALEAKFVKMYWWRCIPFARATLATLLTRPIDEAQKEDIMEALALDASLTRGRVTSADVIKPPSIGELLH